MEKAEVLPRDIKWHFIGGLQSSKLLSVNFPASSLSCFMIWRKRESFLFGDKVAKRHVFRPTPFPTAMSARPWLVFWCASESFLLHICISAIGFMNCWIASLFWMKVLSFVACLQGGQSGQNRVIRYRGSRLRGRAWKQSLLSSFNSQTSKHMWLKYEGTIWPCTLLSDSTFTSAVRFADTY